MHALHQTAKNAEKCKLPKPIISHLASVEIGPLNSSNRFRTLAASASRSASRRATPLRFALFAVAGVGGGVSSLRNVHGIEIILRQKPWMCRLFSWSS